MKTNPILEKNLSYISKYNPELKYKIMQIDSLENEIIISETLLQEPNLSYNGVPIHNIIGAELEAKNIFKKSNNDNLLINVVYGFGLGYLVQACAMGTENPVIIYEPNLEILASTLEIADLSEELSRPNVFVYSDFELFKNKYMQECSAYTSTVILFLPSYKDLFPKEITNFVEQMNVFMGTSSINEKYIKNSLIPAIKSVCNNIDVLVNEVPLIEYENLYKGKTAVIVSAGPSLDYNIEVLKKYRENVIIIAVSQALKTLMRNSIEPDFVCSIEMYNQSAHIKGLDVSNIDLILEPCTNRVMHTANFKNHISYPAGTSLSNLVWTKMVNINPSHYVSSGTVSYVAMNSAVLMGFKNIILVGQDLAYIDGKCYTNGNENGLQFKKNMQNGKVEIVATDIDALINVLYGDAETRTEDDKIKLVRSYLSRLNSSLYYVDGIRGDKVPTLIAFASFIKEFEKFAVQNFKKCNFYNTSLSGAQINGFENVSLIDLIRDIEPVERLNINKNKNFKIDLNLLATSISHEVSNLNSILKLLQTAKTICNRFDKIISNRNNLTNEAIDTFKQIMLIYLDINENFSKKSAIFKLISMSKKIDLNNHLKLYKSIDEKAVNDVYEHLKNYIIDMIKELSEVLIILDGKVVQINEMLNSAS